MFLRALAAFLVLPGLVAGIVPPLITLFDPWQGSPFAPGLIVLIAGFLILMSCVQDFYVSGKGTLAPWSPPEHLVTTGLYRYSRNPMYIGVLTIIGGWTIWLMSPLLLIYGMAFTFIFHMRVTRYEEPWLSERYGKDWSEYCRHANRWVGF
ncbi:MAG: isoprenylcysteine carboxylmethyltransferase family protein [Gammaproteobacteria bacterium]|nr:isoprenylcysteine carboxylmethyltransferase family protein [Gammaproteobacteria bacterium]